MASETHCDWLSTGTDASRPLKKRSPKSLEGDWRSEHLFVLRLAWENGKQVQEQIKKCDQELMQYTRQLEAKTMVAQPIVPVKIMSLNVEPGVPELTPAPAVR